MSFRDIESPTTVMTDMLKDLQKRIVNLEQAGTDQVALGAMVLWSAPAVTAEPTGWLRANGQAVSRTKYAALFALIGTTFGAGDGTLTFNVPNPAAYGGVSWILKT